ncbi:MAG: GGDEF domain-containing protein [Terracidiphilus sp.]|jgi:diguanylate cyclase (GGDEF)-like protein
MKKTISAVVLLLGCTTCAWAAPSGALTTLLAIRDLTNEEANRHLPVAIEATVTYYRGYEYSLFVQDDGVGIYVSAPPDLKLIPGDRVLIKGTTEGSYHPIVHSSSVSVLGHADLPKPRVVVFDELTNGQHDCEYVTLRGVVRAAFLINRYSRYGARMILATDGGIVEAMVDNTDIGALNDLLDAEVEVTGIAGGIFDGRMELRGIMLHVFSQGGVRVLGRASTNPWSLPASPIEDLFSSYHVNNLSRRVRIQGIVTYYEPGSFAVLQDGERSIQVTTLQETPLHLGHRAEATGFPDIRNDSLSLSGAEIRESVAYAPIAPKRVTRRELSSSKNSRDLVSIEGQVVMELREESQDQYFLYADGYMFSAIFRHVDSDVGPPLPMKQVPVGSIVRVIGICMMESSNPFAGDVPFNLLMRSPDDISVVVQPSWINVRNLIAFVGFLLVVVAIVGARGWALEHKVRRKTAALAASVEAEAALQRQSAHRERHLAQLEQQRSRILEEINGLRSLSQILEEIVEMVSFGLDGVPCWCEIVDGPTLGSHPQEQGALRIASAQIESRSGSALGVLFAGFDPATTPGENETGALQHGARLATLAIETRGLYSDLRRRSEFDQLTDIPNRFALGKFMDSQIEQARQSGEILGLIYIDLDKFKPINDTYGHHVGDLYLQEVARRMSRQLLGHDILARLGGDEFAAMVSLPNGRPDLDKIIARLERCFDEPFDAGGLQLIGEASIGSALFPENGASKDALLSAADAAMYEVKNEKRRSQPKSGSGSA